MVVFQLAFLLGLEINGLDDLLAIYIESTSEHKIDILTSALQNVVNTSHTKQEIILGCFSHLSR